MADCDVCGLPIPPRASGRGGPRRKRHKDCKPAPAARPAKSRGTTFASYPTDLHLPHPAPRPEPPPRPPRRTCAEPGCGTVLSAYNREDVCALHEEADWIF